MLTKVCVFNMFVKPNELIVLNGAVISTGIIESVDGDRNDGMLVLGKGKVGRARLYAIETRRGFKSM